jgi:hypothetical protein
LFFANVFKIIENLLFAIYTFYRVYAAPMDVVVVGVIAGVVAYVIIAKSV